MESHLRAPAVVVLCLVTILATACIRRIPHHAGRPAEPSATEIELAESLREHVETLAEEIGSRSYRSPQDLDAAGEYVLGAFRSIVGDERAASLVRALPSPVSRAAYTQMRWRNLRYCKRDDAAAREQLKARHFRNIRRQEFWNIELTLPGTSHPDEVIVVGAHYDSDACESGGANPGADDNASGVAALIEIATLLASQPMARTVKLVGFTNEEEPFFQTDGMGSRVYVRQALARGDKIKAMLSLETLGYYSDLPGSQQAPQPFKLLLGLPDTGNFLAFVSAWRSSALTRAALTGFGTDSPLAAEGFVAHPSLVEQVQWSDNWAFDEEGIPALMITDTAPARNRCYHQACDVPARLDYVRMAHAVTGLARAITTLANAERLPD